MNTVSNRAHPTGSTKAAKHRARPEQPPETSRSCQLGEHKDTCSDSGFLGNGSFVKKLSSSLGLYISSYTKLRLSLHGHSPDRIKFLLPYGNYALKE